MVGKTVKHVVISLIYFVAVSNNFQKLDYCISHFLGSQYNLGVRFGLEFLVCNFLAGCLL